jgi:hypothetical protein
MFALNPGLSGEQVKNFIIESATQTVPDNNDRESDDESLFPSGYKLLNAEGALNKALGVEITDYDKKDYGVLTGNILLKNDVGMRQGVENYNIRIYDSEGNFIETDNIQNLVQETYHEYGIYEILLESGKPHKIEVVKSGYKKTIIEDIILETGEYRQLDIYIESLSSIAAKDIVSSKPIVIKFEDASLSDDDELFTMAINEDGKLLLDVEDGIYTLRVKKEGYEDYEAVVEVKNGKLYLNGELLEEIFLTPTGKFTVSGAVTSAVWKTPIAGANIEIRLSGGDGPAYASVQTDDYGGYSVDLDFGSYEFIISKEEYKSQTISVEANENKTADFEMASKRGTVNFHMYDLGTLERIPNMTISLYRFENGIKTEEITFISDVMGAFSFYVEEGEYEYTAIKSGYSLYTAYFEVKGDIAHVIDSNGKTYTSRVRYP